MQRSQATVQPVGEQDRTLSELRALLESASPFARLSEEDLDRLLSAATELEFSAGDLVVREGDQAGDCFVVQDGSLQVSTEREDGTRVVLARLTSGTIFGEQALLSGDTGRRNATVRASEASRVVCIRRASLVDLLQAHPELRETLLERGRDQESWNQARRSGLFEHLLPLSESAGAPVERCFAPGEAVFCEGDEPESVYLILEGRARVEREGQTLVVLRPGQCFGELGPLDRSPRRATVLAMEALTVQVIDGETFRALHEESAFLQAHFAAVRRTYKLSSGEQVSQAWLTLDSTEWVETTRTLPDGRSLAIRYEPIGALVVCGTALSSDSPELEDLQRVEYSSVAFGLQRRLWLSPEGRLVGAEARGPWGQLPGVLDAVLRKAIPEPEALRAFEQGGELRSTTAEPAAECVCLCLQLDQSQVLESVLGGSDTLAALGRELGCGTICGACVPRLRILLGNISWVPVEAELRTLAPDILGIRLTRSDGVPLEAGQAGQHVLLSALVDGRWLDRPYTVVSPAGHRGSLELVVKREPLGHLSQWLFDPVAGPRRFRVSSPRGDAAWTAGSGPTVCFAAGIGITPTLSILRTALAEDSSQPLILDCSFRNRESAVFTDELEAAANTEHIQVRLRWTASEGRLSTADVQRQAAAWPDALFFLCGPASFMASVSSGLLQAGVQEERILLETFTPTSALPPSNVPPLPPAPSSPAPSSPASPARSGCWLGLLAVVLALLLALLLLPNSTDEQRLAPDPAEPGHEGLTCSGCHEDLALEGDPLDISHEQLAGEGRWDGCLGCHDFHESHGLDAPRSLGEALDPSTIDADLRGAPAP